MLVAYQMGDVARNLRQTCDRPGVQIRICLADMWDEPLVNAYQRKYHDRTSNEIRDSVKKSMERLLGPCKFNLDERGVLQSIAPEHPPNASYEIRLTPQRITHSFYRVDNTCFVIPLDMKRAQDPAPFAWTLSHETSPREYRHYVEEYQLMFKEARRVL